MVVETAVAAVAETAAEVIAEAAVAEVAEAAEATVAEGVSISGAAELSETLSAIQKEIPREVIGERVDAMLQDEAFRAEIQEAIFDYETRLADLKERGLIHDFSEHCRFEAQLSEDRYLESDYQQFKDCNEQLNQAYENGTLDPERFTDRQLEQIHNGDKPEGYTWHHHEERGRMQLVDSDIHRQTPHVGGRSLWGGGSESR